MTWGAANQSEHAPLGWLLQAPGADGADGAEDPESALATAAAASKERSAPDWEEALARVAARCPGAIGIETLSGADAPEPVRPDAPAAVLRARRLERALRRTRQMTSYSALARGTGAAATTPDHEVVEMPDHDGDDAPRTDAEIEGTHSDPREAPERTPFTFPSGPRAGNCLHRIFERLDARHESVQDLDALCRESLAAHGFGAEWADVARTMVENARRVRLAASAGPGVGAGFRLRDLARPIAEMEFHLPAHRLDRQRLGATLAAHGYGNPFARAGEPSAGEREGLAPRKKEPSAGEREGAPLAREEPSAGEREGARLARKEPSAGEREGARLARKEPSAGEREGARLARKEPSAGERARPSVALEFPLRENSASGEREGLAPRKQRQREGARLGRDRPIEGFLRGFIDLVAVHDGRWYVVDYKSNFLGPSPESYGAEGLGGAIARGGYRLQYLLYVLALHRYLSVRQPGYDYEKHVGRGVLPVPARRGSGGGHGPRGLLRPAGRRLHRRARCLLRRPAASMSTAAIDALCDAGLLLDIDRAFADLIAACDGRGREEIALAAALASARCRAGHVYLDLPRCAGVPLAAALDASAEPLPEETPRLTPELGVWRRLLEGSPAVAATVGGLGTVAPRPLVLDERDRLYLARFRSAEGRVADGLLALAAPRGPSGGGGDKLVEALFGDGHAEGRAAARTVLERGLCVVTGGPGTGKTTLAARLIALLVGTGLARPDGVRLAAPTGRRRRVSRKP